MNDEELKRQLKVVAARVAELRKGLGAAQSQAHPRQALVSRLESGGDVRLSSLLIVLDRLGLELRIEPRRPSSSSAPAVAGVVDYTQERISHLLQRFRVED